MAESADERTWRTLPSEIAIARARIPPGPHTITLQTRRANAASSVNVAGRYAVVGLRLLRGQLFVKCPRRANAGLPPTDGRLEVPWRRKMNRTWTIIALLVAALAAGCATKKGFEKPGFAFGCPIGDAKVSSMEDLVKLKVVPKASARPSRRPRCAAR